MLFILAVKLADYQAGDHHQYRSGTKTVVRKWHMVNFKLQILDFEVFNLTFSN
jgi:hypothetical protein